MIQAICKNFNDGNLLFPQQAKQSTSPHLSQEVYSKSFSLLLSLQTNILYLSGNFKTIFVHKIKL